MTDREKALTRIDLRHIQSDGRYVNFEKNIITYLNYEDILFLRTYHNDRTIAANFEFRNIKTLEPARLKTPGQVQRKKNTTTKTQPARSTKPASKKAAAKSTTGKRNLTVVRENKYTGNKHKGIKFDGKRIVAVAGAIVLCITFFHSFAKNDVTTLPADPGYGIVATAPQDVAGYGDIITTTNPTETQEVDAKTEMRQIVDEVARIYQVDPNILYTIIMENTNNLTSDDYLENYTFEGVSYKGSGQVDCTSPTQMAILAGRALDQDAPRYGYERENIKKTNNNKTEKNYDNYVDMIGYYCEVLGEDPCLIYGIMQAETGWSSRLLDDLNNPAGLKLNNGNWWKFDTIESGIIELILQVHSYRWAGANTVEEMAAIHCPIDDPDDVGKVNQYWVGNVKEGMAEARAIYANRNFSTGTNRL